MSDYRGRGSLGAQVSFLVHALRIAADRLYEEGAPSYMVDDARSAIAMVEQRQVPISEDAIDAALTAGTPGPVAVKPLEWEGLEKSGVVEYWSVQTALHQNAEYEVYDSGGGLFRCDFDGSRIAAGCDSPEEAKAAAQADYERRIRSTLVVTPIANVLAALEPFAKAVFPDATTMSGWRFGTAPSSGDYQRAHKVFHSLPSSDRIADNGINAIKAERQA
ncbi:hypothetical protein [Aurantimonas coralicida]|uniref:hypothetical protein n=1 Tax=Aurantimonas coralicida TaxID=182270 RepID=UPI001E64545A|nr:hypothetical protein [Aurantimonas coralicida]MCD1645253.1 hypothetical protein [Aurantimonas coralicida]